MRARRVVLDLLDRRARPDRLVLPARPVPLVRLGVLVRQDRPDQRALQDLQEAADRQVQLGRPELQVTLELPERLVRQVAREQQVLLALRERPEPPGSRERQALRALLVRQESRVQRAVRDLLEALGLPARPE